MNEVRNQRCLVAITGVTHGLGYAMVNEFVRLGHTVAGCGRSKEEISHLQKAFPGHQFSRVDVASDRQVKEWSETILRRHGTPDLVINNAGVLNRRAPLWEITDREFSGQLDSNVRGTVNVIRHFAPALVQKRHGVIVNFASRWGLAVESGIAPYCASKWAVVALTQTLASELQPYNVYVVAFNPGTVRTRMLEKYFDYKGIPEPNVYLTPERWAGLAVPFILRLDRGDSGMVRALAFEQEEALK